MSPITRRFLISAAAFMVAGVSIGLWLMVRRELYQQWPPPLLVSAHAHLILVGAVLETILGTALWLFPRPLGSDRLEVPPVAWASWWLLTVGTVLRTGTEIARVWSVSDLLKWGVVIGGTAQVVGVICGVLALRSRVRGSVRPSDLSSRA